MRADPLWLLLLAACAPAATTVPPVASSPQPIPPPSVGRISFAELPAAVGQQVRRHVRLVAPGGASSDAQAVETVAAAESDDAPNLACVSAWRRLRALASRAADVGEKTPEIAELAADLAATADLRVLHASLGSPGRAWSRNGSAKLVFVALDRSQATFDVRLNLSARDPVVRVMLKGQVTVDRSLRKVFGILEGDVRGGVGRWKAQWKMALHVHGPA